MCEKNWFSTDMKKGGGVHGLFLPRFTKYMWWEDNSNFSLIGLITISLARIILL